MKVILVLVSKPENEDNKSRSRLDARDWRRFFLGLVSKPEIKCQKFWVSSRCARLNLRNSHSHLENEKMTLADLCTQLATLCAAAPVLHLQLYRHYYISLGNDHYANFLLGNKPL